MEGNTVREAWHLNNKMTSESGESAVPSLSMFAVSADHVMIDAWPEGRRC